MSFVIPVYIVLYTFVGGLGLAMGVKRKYPRWLISVEVLGASAAMTGMVLYYFEYRAPEIVSVWRYVFFFILIEHIGAAGYEFQIESARKHPELTEGQSSFASYSGLLLGTLLVFPAIFMNFLYAFNRGGV